MNWKEVLGIILIVLGIFVVLAGRSISGSVIGVIDVFSKISFFVGLGLIAGGVVLLAVNKKLEELVEPMRQKMLPTQMEKFDQLEKRKKDSQAKRFLECL